MSWFNKELNSNANPSVNLIPSRYLDFYVEACGWTASSAIGSTSPHCSLKSAEWNSARVKYFKLFFVSKEHTKARLDRKQLFSYY